MIHKIRAMWRAFVLSTLLPVALAACTTTSSPLPANIARAVSPNVIQRYAVPPNEMFDVDAVDTTEMDPKNLRQVVDYPTTQQPGTIIVDPHKRFLYLMMGNGQALRYGVGVGKAGLEFSGTATVQAKKPWPRWTPTPDMIRREPGRYRPWAKGMEGGIKKSARRSRALSFQKWQGYAVPHPWHHRAGKHRKGCIIRLHSHAEPGCDRSL